VAPGAVTAVRMLAGAGRAVAAYRSGLLVLWDLEGRAALWSAAVLAAPGGGALGGGALRLLAGGAGGAGAGGVELNIFDGSKDRAEWAEVAVTRSWVVARRRALAAGGAGAGARGGGSVWVLPVAAAEGGGARELFQAADVSCLAARELAPAGAGVGAGAGAGAEVLLVATGARDGSVRVWGVRGGAADDEAGGAVVLSGHSRAASAVAVLGARCVVSGGADADVRVWDPLAPRPCVQVLRGHAGRVEQVWTDGTQVVSAALAGGADGGHHEIRVWNVRSGQCAAVLRRAPSLRGLEGPTAPAPAAPAPAARVAAMRVLHNVRPRRLPHPRRPASCGARRVARCAERERARARRQPLTLVTLDGAGRLTIWTRAEAARLPQAPPRPPAPEPARARARAPRLTKGFNCAQLAPGPGRAAHKERLRGAGLLEQPASGQPPAARRPQLSFAADGPQHAAPRARGKEAGSAGAGRSHGPASGRFSAEPAPTSERVLVRNDGPSFNGFPCAPPRQVPSLRPRRAAQLGGGSDAHTDRRACRAAVLPLAGRLARLEHAAGGRGGAGAREKGVGGRARWAGSREERIMQLWPCGQPWHRPRPNPRRPANLSSRARGRSGAQF
jgi:hypothetical protein